MIDFRERVNLIVNTNPVFRGLGNATCLADATITNLICFTRSSVTTINKHAETMNIRSSKNKNIPVVPGHSLLSLDVTGAATLHDLKEVNVRETWGYYCN